MSVALIAPTKHELLQMYMFFDFLKKKFRDLPQILLGGSCRPKRFSTAGAFNPSFYSFSLSVTSFSFSVTHPQTRGRLMKKNYFTNYSTCLRFCLLLPLLAGSLLTFGQVTRTVGGTAGADYQTLGSAADAGCLPEEWCSRGVVCR